MLETLKTLCALSGVSGAEDEVRDYILQRVLPLADTVDTDAMGNVIVHKKGAAQMAKKLLLCAHMDEVGFIVRGVTEEGFLRFASVGGIDRRVLPGKRVYIGRDRLPGVIGCKPYHLVDKKEESSCPKEDELLIDIGCRSREDAEKRVELGACCTFSDSVFVLGDGYLKAKAIDDRVGCAVMLKLLECDLPCDVTFAFTAQEEVGTRGAAVAAYATAPDVCLILEGTTATDLPDVGEEKIICHAGSGVVIPFMDGGTVYDRGLYGILTSLAEENGIPWQTKRRVAGGTDGRAVQRSRTGVKTAALACAVRNIHSPASVGKISEFEDMLRLAELFLERFAKGDI